jgi:hypothetical protein
MKCLIKLGAKYDEKDKVSCCTLPCIVCVLTCRMRSCLTSISSLPVPCICFQHRKTPFQNAALNLHLDAMKYLVELGAEYDVSYDNVSCYTHPCVVWF